MNQSKYISIKECSQKTGVSEGKFYDMLRNGEIPSGVKVGDKWTVDRITFELWLLYGERWREEFHEVIKLTLLLHDGVL